MDGLISEQKLTINQTKKMITDDSITELTFSYVFDCLQSFGDNENFLGFTLNNEAAKQHKNRNNNFSELKNYFAAEVLKSIIVFQVPQQNKSVIKWTDKTALENYLRSYGVDISL